MENTMLYYTYKVTNKKNGKYYFGAHSSNSLDDGYLGSGTGIKRAVKKYGRESFERTVLEVFDNEDDLYLAEEKLIPQSIVDDRMSYNGTLGGRGGWSHIDVRGDKNPMKNPEVAAKSAKALKAVKNGPKKEFYDEIARQNQKKSVIANTGKPRSEETRRKISEAQIGKVISEETKQKMKEAWKTREPDSDETRQKKSEAQKRLSRDMGALTRGKKQSPEQIAKRSAAMKESWRKRKLLKEQTN